MTNYEKIKNMSIEKMVEAMEILDCTICPALSECERKSVTEGCQCNKFLREWLKSEEIK